MRLALPKPGILSIVRIVREGGGRSGQGVPLLCRAILRSPGKGAQGRGVHFWTPTGLQGRGFGTQESCKCLKRFGGPGEIRTHDLFHAMEARSQLRHRPPGSFLQYITAAPFN